MLSVKNFVFNPFMENTLVVYDETTLEAAIVDCGCLYETERRELKKFIDDNRLKVKYLLNTHLHLDHQFGNAWAAAEYGVLPRADRNDEKLIGNLTSQAMIFGIPERVEAQPLGGYIAEGDEIKLGNATLLCTRRNTDSGRRAVCRLNRTYRPAGRRLRSANERDTPKTVHPAARYESISRTRTDYHHRQRDRE